MKKGDRIEMISMLDPDPIPAGERGTVVEIFEHIFAGNPWKQVDVDWDSGRFIMLTIPPDRVKILKEGD